MVSTSWLQKNKKIVYIIMIFAVSVWGISFSAMELIPKKPIAKVLGRKITQDEFTEMAIRWQRLFFPQTQESIIPIVWKQFLMVEKANQMGLMITSPEVEDGLRRIAFQVFGQTPELEKRRLMQFLCNTFKLTPDQTVVLKCFPRNIQWNIGRVHYAANKSHVFRQKRLAVCLYEDFIAIQLNAVFQFF